MVHTAKDYSNKYRQPTVYGNIDNAELAARLFSINTYVRSGSIVWMDDFEDNINHWCKTAVGTGASVVLSDEAARNGKYSAKMTTPSDTADYCSLQRAIGMLNTSKIGFELSYADQDDNTRLSIMIAIYDGTTEYYGILRISEAAGTLEIWDDIINNYVTLDTLTIDSEICTWNTMKLIIDMDSLYYVRGYFNNEEYDLTAYRLRDVALATSPRIAVAVLLHRTVADNYHVYVDDAIITQNEPF